MGGYVLKNEESIPSVSQTFSQRFSTRERPKYINTKQMFPVLSRIQKWQHNFNDAHSIIYGDNFAVIQGITYFSIRGRAITPLRKMFMLFALNNIMPEAI